MQCIHRYKKFLHWYHDSKFLIDILVYGYISPIPTKFIITLRDIKSAVITFKSAL